MNDNMIFFITNMLNSVSNRESETAIMTADTTHAVIAQTHRRTCPTPELQYHWEQTRHFLEGVLHMKSVDIFPVAYWAWNIALRAEAAEDEFTRQMHELSGVLVAPDGAIVGYTMCMPTNSASGTQWSDSILRPDTCAGYGLDADKPIPVGNGYWFAHPAIMHGQQVAHVRYISVGMG